MYVPHDLPGSPTYPFRPAKKPVKAIRINIGGKPYIFMISQLSHPSSSLLAKFVSERHEDRLYRADAYLEESKQYYWARSPHLFQPIADFYFHSRPSTSPRRIHLPPEICRGRFLEELKFWGLPASLIANCEFCPGRTNAAASPAIKLPKIERINSAPDSFHYGDLDLLETEDAQRRRQLLSNLALLSRSPLDTISDIHTDENENRNSYYSLAGENGADFKVETLQDFHNKKSSCTEWKASVWRTTENPDVSCLAKIWACTSMFFVILSVTGLLLGSMEQCQDASGDPLLLFAILEWVCIAWFIFELVTRFVVTPNRKRFFLEFLNIVDLLSILPFFFEVIVVLAGAGNSQELQSLQGVIFMLRILKVLRVSRIFKLARYSSGMQTFGMVLKNSLSELGISLIALVTVVIFFSTLMYFIEKDTKESPFHSIPSACYWAIITMTTVGYGDDVPVTPGGKVLASITSLSGVLVLAFPVTTIVGNFNKYTQTQEADSKKDKDSIMDEKYDGLDSFV